MDAALGAGRPGPALILLLSILLLAAYGGGSFQAGSGVAGFHVIKLEYELGPGLLSPSEVVGLLGVDQSLMSSPQGGYSVCLAVSDPQDGIDRLNGLPEVNVRCWGAQCPSLISGEEARSLFTKVKAAFICAAEARLHVEIRGGSEARFRLALNDYVFISFKEPWFTTNYTPIRVSAPEGLGGVSVYFGSGDSLEFTSVLAREDVSRGLVDLAVLVGNASWEGWLALYHHSPLSTIELDGTVHPMAMVVYNTRAGGSGYVGEAVYWWAKVIRVEDPAYYNDVASMARILAERWNATLETDGNDTIIVKAEAAGLLGLPRSPYWEPTYYNITRLEDFYELVDGYGAVQADGSLYIVDPRLLRVDPLRLQYTVNGSLAILESVDVDVKDYGQPALGAATAVTLVEPPLVPGILLYTLNVTGIAVKGHRLLSLADAAAYAQAPAVPGEEHSQEPPGSPTLPAAAAALAILLTLALLVKYKVAGRGGPR